MSRLSVGRIFGTATPALDWPDKGLITVSDVNQLKEGEIARYTPALFAWGDVARIGIRLFRSPGLGSCLRLFRAAHGSNYPLANAPVQGFN